jgi:dihydrofolate reductase
MILSAIVAASDNNVIGNKGKIPWNLPADWAFVSKVTMGHPIIMGSATHNSIGRALPGRTNIVISRNPAYKPRGSSILVNSLDEALSLIQVQQTDEAFVFGGEAIYELAMPKLQKIYLTRIHTTVDGDKFFNYDKGIWKEVSKDKHKKDEKNPYDYDFIILKRR